MDLLKELTKRGVAVMLMLSLFGCGGGDGGGGGQVPGGSSTGLSSTEQALKVGMTGGAFLDNTITSTNNLLVEAAFFLNSLGVDVIGTLQQSVSDPAAFSYSPTPDDRLRIILANGTEIVYDTSAISGDFGFDANFFLLNEYQLRYKVIVAPIIDLTIDANRGNGVLWGTVSGTAQIEGTSYTVSLTLGGSYVPFTSITKPELTGTVTANGFDMQVNETIEFVSGQSIFLTNKSNNSWTAEGSQFQYTAEISKAFQCGHAANVASDWQANGSLTQDGATIGALSVNIESAADQINIAASAPDGPIILERYRLSSGGSGTFDQTPFGNVGGDGQFIYFINGDTSLTVGC